jgi:sortase A
VPRDWRWVVGGIGRVLIATGLLLFGFVGYQLWGTGLEYAQAQDRLEDDFAALIAGLGAVTDDTAAASTATTAGPPSTSPSPSPSPSSVPTTSVPPETTPATTAAPVTVPDFESGDVMARLEIPSVGIDSYVVSGVRPSDLKKGPGHYPTTPHPGQLGNSAIAGHRTTYGQPFFRLGEVETGDEIIVTTVQGRFVYRVTGSEIVPPSRSDVIATTDPTVARLTLTTCHPKYTATNRLIVYAELDQEASSAPPQQPVVEEDETPPETLPGDAVDPTVPVTVGTTVPDIVTGDPGGATADPGGGGAAGADDGDDVEDDVSGELADAFAHGWFSDDGAWPHVAMWGSALTAISLGAWRLSCLVRRNWVGALAGIVPFVVALYFFYQNVNRLLPAAL